MFRNRIFSKIVKNETVKDISDSAIKTIKTIFPTKIGETIDLFKKNFLDRKFISNLSIEKRIEAFHNGFTAEEYCYYGIQEGRHTDLYLPAYIRNTYTGSINENPELLNNKLKFYRYFEKSGLSKYSPRILGVIEKGKFSGEESLINTLEKEGKIVIKPFIGYSGKQVFICEKMPKKIKVNGKEKDIDDFESFYSNLDNFLVSEYCIQSDFFKNFYPKSANTVRILTLYTDEGYYIVDAALRIGTSRSGYIDNRSSGGLTVDIDLETGRLGKAAETLPSGDVRWHKVHPETGAQLKGVYIPDWDNFKESFLDLINGLPRQKFKYVGWDILFTKDHFVILEGNNRPGLLIFQVHRPILKDPKVRNFFNNHDIPI